MRRLGQDLVANLVAVIRDTKTAAAYTDNGLEFETYGAKFLARLDGEVFVRGLWGNAIPVDWNQRRSIRRAVAWRHRYEGAELIRLGKQARAATSQQNR